MFDSEKNSFDAIDYLIKKYSNSKIVLSYSSNSLPTLKEIKDIVKKNKKELIVKKINYTYSFGTQKKGKDIKNLVKEYIILIK